MRSKLFNFVKTCLMFLDINTCRTRHGLQFQTPLILADQNLFNKRGFGDGEVKMGAEFCDLCSTCALSGLNKVRDVILHLCTEESSALKLHKLQNGTSPVVLILAPLSALEAHAPYIRHKILCPFS